jgi:peptidoglycan hydrolase-like protein with peptidoglycan-binding domain
LGSSGKEVLLLQRFLNSEENTQIAITGKNAPGSETGVFDAATSRAVKAFQLRNKAEVLTPVGLTAPNGVVGKYTRAAIAQKLCGVAATNKFFIMATSTPAAVTDAEALNNQKKLAALRARIDGIVKQSSQEIDAKVVLLNTKTAEVQAKIDKLDKNVADQEAVSHLLDILSTGDEKLLMPALGGDFGKSDPLRLLFFSIANGHRGERIALVGTGFLAKNVVHFGTQILDSGTPNASGTVLYVTIPGNATNGKQEIYIENTKGKSMPKIITIVDGGIPPHISSVIPKYPKMGEVVTITGDHFTAKNDILTTFGPISGVPSPDGRTMSFVLSPEAMALFNTTSLKSLPFSLGVSNGSGVSNMLTLSLR